MGMLGQQPGGSGTPVIRVNVETEHLAHGREFLARAEVHESDDKSVSLGHQEVASANQAAGKGSRPLMSSLLDGILQPIGREESREADSPRLGVCFPYRWRIRQSCVSDLHGSHSLSRTLSDPANRTYGCLCAVPRSACDKSLTKLSMKTVVAPAEHDHDTKPAQPSPDRLGASPNLTLLAWLLHVLMIAL